MRMLEALKNSLDLLTLREVHKTMSFFNCLLLIKSSKPYLFREKISSLGVDNS